MKKRETWEYEHILKRYEKGDDADAIREIRMIVTEAPSLKAENNRLRAKDGMTGSLIRAIPELLRDYEHLAPDADGKIDPVRKRRIGRIAKLLHKINPPQSSQVFTGADLEPARRWEDKSK